MKKVNRKSLPRWTKHLTAAEIKHMANDGGGVRLETAKKNWEHAKAERAESGFPCWDCLSIGNKLQEAGVFK